MAFSFTKLVENESENPMSDNSRNLAGRGTTVICHGISSTPDVAYVPYFMLDFGKNDIPGTQEGGSCSKYGIGMKKFVKRCEQLIASKNAVDNLTLCTI